MPEALTGGLAVPDAAERLRRRRDWLGFLAISMGSFIAILDIQIVASSINQIQAGLSASADEIQWVQTSYLIAEVIAIPLSGYMARLLSTRVYFTLSALGFTLASLLCACACAWNLSSMVAYNDMYLLLSATVVTTLLMVPLLAKPKAEVASAEH